MNINHQILDDMQKSAKRFFDQPAKPLKLLLPSFLKPALDAMTCQEALMSGIDCSTETYLIDDAGKSNRYLLPCFYAQPGEHNVK